MHRPSPLGQDQSPPQVTILRAWGDIGQTSLAITFRRLKERRQWQDDSHCGDQPPIHPQYRISEIESQHHPEQMSSEFHYVDKDEISRKYAMITRLVSEQLVLRLRQPK